MATLAAPSRELLIAMKALGVEAWFPGGRMRVRVRRDEATEIAFTKRGPEMRANKLAMRDAGTVTPGGHRPGEIVGMVGLGVLAAGTAVWAFQRYEDSNAMARVVSRSNVRGAQGLSRTFTAAATMLLGVGALAVSMLGLMGRRSRR